LLISICQEQVAVFFFLVLVIGFVSLPLMANYTAEFYQKLPDVVAGWKKAEHHAVYTPNNLAEYIDGGAELFISYHFQSALSVKYLKNTNNEISVDIFDMGTSYDAFGVFAHSREKIDQRVGQGCEYAAGLLTFWKDKFYVSILAYPETAEKKEVVFKLGQAIAREIKNEGPLPPIIALLPAENLIPESVHYFHHYIWLNSFFFVSNENILNITPDTPAALGKYRQRSGTFFLLLVLYPDEDKAKAAHEQFRQKQLAGSEKGILQTEEGSWTGCERQDELFSAVFKAPDAQTVRAMLAKIQK